MIIFDLVCQENHPFEGWFHSVEAFESQLKEELICCPHCGSPDIHRVPSALHIAKSTEEKASESARTTPAVRTDEMHTAFRQLMSALISGSEDVGKAFSEEARRIHYMEAPARAIRGETSIAEYESLREEGIEVLLLPTLKKEEMN